MKPILFKQATGKHSGIPTLRFRNGQNPTISCWKGTWRDRLRFLFTGKMWTYIEAKNNPMPPYFIATDRSIVFTVKKKKQVKEIDFDKMEKQLS